MVNLKVIFACTQINPLQAGRNVISYGAYNTTFRAAANGVYPTPPLNKSDISSSQPPPSIAQNPPLRGLFKLRRLFTPSLTRRIPGPHLRPNRLTRTKKKVFIEAVRYSAAG